ncbi:hypothetical protein MBGDC06_00330, partial [Thermoplasmatales archaeon SCGC AB-539-C06]
MNKHRRKLAAHTLFDGCFVTAKA